MKTTHTSPPKNKKEYIIDIGKLLVKYNGKKKYYKPIEIKKAHRKSKWYEEVAICSWAMATFSSQADFDQYHKKRGENVDFVEMKIEMLGELSSNTEGWAEDWIGFSTLDFDVSWLDFGEIFGDFFEGIGDAIGGIFEGIIS